MNIDPTNEDIVIFFTGTSGSETVSFTNGTQPDLSASDALGTATTKGSQYIAETMGFGDNGVLKINYNANSAANAVFENQASLDDTAANSLADAADYYMVFYEGADNSGTFYNTDDADTSNLIVSATADRGTTATIDYNDSPVTFLVTNDFGDLDMDEASVGDEWNSGETLAVTLIDQDLNKNSWSDEDMVLTNAYNSTIPSLQIGSPITLSGDSLFGSGNATDVGMTAGTFNKIVTLTSPYAGVAHNEFTQLTFNGTTVADARTALGATFVFLNFDLTELTGTVTSSRIS